MVTGFVCAVFSKAVYQSNEILLRNHYPLGWEFIESRDISNGFRIAAFEHSLEKKIIFAVRGTVPGLHNLEADIDLFLKQDKNLIRDYRDYIKDFYQTLKEKHPAFYQYYLTGHSLGAFLAELSSLDLNIPAITFDSPGCVPFLPSNENQKKKLLIRGEKLITTYFSSPHPINTCHPHVGKLYMVYVPDDRFFEQKKNQQDESSSSSKNENIENAYAISQASFSKGCASAASVKALVNNFNVKNLVLKSIYSEAELTFYRHSIENILLAFNPETEQPYFCRKVLQWPTLKGHLASQVWQKAAKYFIGLQNANDLRDRSSGLIYQISFDLNKQAQGDPISEPSKIYKKLGQIELLLGGIVASLPTAHQYFQGNMINPFSLSMIAQGSTLGVGGSSLLGLKGFSFLKKKANDFCNYAIQRDIHLENVLHSVIKNSSGSFKIEVQRRHIQNTIDELMQLYPAVYKAHNNYRFPFLVHFLAFLCFSCNFIDEEKASLSPFYFQLTLMFISLAIFLYTNVYVKGTDATPLSIKKFTAAVNTLEQGCKHIVDPQEDLEGEEKLWVDNVSNVIVNEEAQFRYKK